MICCTGAVRLTEPAALLSLGEVFEAIGCTSLGFLVLLDVPRQLRGDVGDKEAAWSQAVIVSSHPELTVLGDETEMSPVSQSFVKPLKVLSLTSQTGH